MRAYSPKRYPPARPFVWVQRLDPSNRLAFTAAEERWMAERLAAFGLEQSAVPPEIREGRLPRVKGLPDGFSEDAPPLLSQPASGELNTGWRFRG